jgi:hypothetical protein
MLTRSESNGAVSLNKPSLRMNCRIKSGNTTSKIVLATRFRARALFTTTTPSQKIDSPRQIKGGEAPKGACQPCPRSTSEYCRPPMPSARLRATIEGAPAFRRFRRGTRHRLSPRWLSPRTGFPHGTARKVFCPLAASRLELSTLRADRSFCRPTGAPEPPGSGSHPSARGHRIPLRLPKVPSRKAPLASGICLSYPI